MFGDLPASPAPVGLTVGRKGFRTFFLLAAAFAVAILPLWMLSLLDVVHPGVYLDPTYWHAHEMVFGFSVAVIAGFLLTAVGNWTQRETLVGVPLLAIGGMWLLGRVAMVAAPVLPRGVPAAVDLAFLPALAVAIGRPLVATKNRRNFVMLALLAALWLADLSVHLDVLGVLPGWRRRGSLFAVDLVVLMILIMAARVFPMFTRNATGVASIRSLPVLDALTAASMAALALADVVLADSLVATVLAGTTCVLAVARSIPWGARHSLGVPLLWILHVGYAWIPIGLLLRVVSAFSGALPAAVATHALTVGAIGGITLGMMSRVSLGHTGRTLTAPKPVAVSFVLITLAAIARVLVPLIGAVPYRASVYASGILWTAAFAIYIVVYTPLLTAPRPDGKPG